MDKEQSSGPVPEGNGPETYKHTSHIVALVIVKVQSMSTLDADGVGENLRTMIMKAYREDQLQKGCYETLVSKPEVHIQRK